MAATLADVKTEQATGYWWYRGGQHVALVDPTGKTLARVIGRDSLPIADLQPVADRLNELEAQVATLREALTGCRADISAAGLTYDATARDGFHGQAVRRIDAALAATEDAR